MKRIFPVILLLALSMAACVPATQLTQLQGKYDECTNERDSLERANERLTVENTEKKARNEQIEKTMKQLAKDSLKRRENIVRLEIEYKTLQERYNKLKESQEALKKGSAAETQALLGELERAQANMLAREERLKKLQSEVDTKTRNLQELQAQTEEQKRRVMELERVLNQKDSLTKALREKVANALVGFEGNGLSITRKDGKVYVSLDEQLLFSSGSFDINDKGKQALRQLAKVLEINSDINILIEGHTDDVPYSSTGQLQDNWDLSVKRATSVVKILLDGSKINPQRLTAAGRGPYYPVNPAKTPEARSKNRRTEIILTPNLDVLYKILNE